MANFQHRNRANLKHLHANLLPNKLEAQPKSGMHHTLGSRGNGRSDISQVKSNSPMINSGTTNTQFSSLNVSYHSGSHKLNDGQRDGLSKKTSDSTNKPMPPPYQPPDYTSLGRAPHVHSGTSTPRQRRKEVRSSRSRNKSGSISSGRSQSLDRFSSRSKSMQESDRQSRDRVRGTHSDDTVTGDGKAHRRPRSQSMDRLLTTARSHTYGGGDMEGGKARRSQFGPAGQHYTPVNIASPDSSLQESNRHSHDRVRSTQTAIGAEKVDGNPRPQSPSHSRDKSSKTTKLHTSDGGNMQDIKVRYLNMGLGGHSNTAVTSVSTDKKQTEGDARSAHSSESSVQTKQTGSNTLTRSESDLPSTPMQGKDINSTQLRPAGHQNTTMHTNRMQSSGCSNPFPRSGGKVGISNLGNTCFMNSMLQCLGQTGEMTEIFLRNNISERKELVRAYSKLMQEMWKESSPTSLSSHALYPRKFKERFSEINPQFSGYNQHDSQEFMRFLVSGLHEELRKQPKLKPEPPKDENDSGQWWKWYMELEHSALAKVFVGQLRSTLKCKSCGHKSLTFDPFWELSVSMQKKTASRSSSSSYFTRYSPTHSSLSTHSHKSVPLEECLDIFTCKEILDGDEKPFCTHCRSLQCCSKRMTIERLPKVLVIHLKRFTGYGYRSKLSTPVTIPHALNLAKYCTDKTSGHTYKLYAISHHTGSVYFGHYTAWCKHYVTGEWHSYNDSSVTPNTSPELTSGTEFPSSTAYVLFYRQQKDSPPYKLKTTSV